MSEKFSGFAAAVASAANKALWDLYNAAATPTSRAKIYEIIVGSPATPADNEATFQLHRHTTTSKGTPAATYTPNNLDPLGPAGQCALGQGAFSVEPTLTANKELLTFPVNQRATFRWVAAPRSEIMLPTTQNYGVALNCLQSSSTQTHSSTVLFEE